MNSKGNKNDENNHTAKAVRQVFTVETQLPKGLLKYARALRKNQTDSEKLLWQLLRGRRVNNWKFRRQHPLSIGYILDFFCSETMVAVELDGAVHAGPEQESYDIGRAQMLEEMGIRVFRFRNEEVLFNTEKVVKEIVAFSSPPTPLHAGERGVALT